MAFVSDLIELSCHMNTDAWAHLSDSTGRSIISHSIEYMGVHTHADFLHAMVDITGLTGFMKWLVETLIYTFFGLVIGSLIALLRQARTT